MEKHFNKRYLEDSIINDALESQKIAFISGPRQVGKTTLSQNILEKFHAEENYFSWDDDEFKKIWIKTPKSILTNNPHHYLALDEIHKNLQWKNKLKGLYDLYKSKMKFIVTGSARMDYYRKSGDSLQGRYFPYRLHPFTVGETTHLKLPPSLENHQWENSSGPGEIKFPIHDLITLSGFPEPLLGANLDKSKRWQRLYRERMVREDARDFQNIRNISNLDNLSLLLIDKMAGQLSYASLREDLSCSFDSIMRWTEILEALYFCYRIRPYSKKIKNSLLKEPKIFLYDWSYGDDAGKQWENFIAGHLLKNVHAWTDCGLGEFELFYLRDKQKREVDFFITKNKKAYLLLEVKSNQSNPTPSLIYFNEILKPDFCFQLVKTKKQERGRIMQHPNIRIIEANQFLSALN
jgi:predicted AAA+ superfamily ATPase